MIEKKKQEDKFVLINFIKLNNNEAIFLPFIEKNWCF
jgi:hypothetical protein